jgi:transposase
MIPGESKIVTAVTHRHASECTIMHALYGLYMLGHSQRYIAKLYNKAPSTISAWVKRWETEEFAGRKKATSSYRKFGIEKRDWIKIFYQKFPLSFIDEACAAFKQEWQQSMSQSTLWFILREQGLTWKVCFIQPCFLNLSIS